jgi:GAF domain-containing protein
VQDAGEFVQVLVGPAPARTILDCYRDLLALCTRHRIDRALVVSSDADGTTHAALAQAVEAMSNWDLAPQFRLAMVAPFEETFAVYRSAERLAAGHGIAARAFREREQAVHWLTEGKGVGRARA